MAAAASINEMGEGLLQDQSFVDDDNNKEAAALASYSAPAVITLKGSPVTARVKRPFHRKKKDEVAGQLEEVLRVQLTVARHQFYHMNLFINLPSASEATPIASCPQFSSAFNHTPLAPSPHQHDAHNTSCDSEQDAHTTLFCVGISDIVSQLGLSLHPYLFVTFVPTGRFKDAPVSIDSITIDLE